MTLADVVADPLPVAGCRITWVAVMVVPLVVPSTKTDSPVVRAVAVVGLPSFVYAVDDSSSTVTRWAACVVKVKFDLDMELTVPAAPPDAGPDRALPAPPAGPAATPPALAVGPGVVAGDAARLMESPVAVSAAVAAAIAHRPRLLDDSRRIRIRCVWLSLPFTWWRSLFVRLRIRELAETEGALKVTCAMAENSSMGSDLAAE